MKTPGRLLAVCGLLFGLMVYSAWRPGALEPGACAAHWERCLGRSAQLAHDTLVVEILPDGFLVEQLGHQARVLADPIGLAPGDSVQLRGAWAAQGVIQAEAWHVSRLRQWRLWVSLPAAALGAWLFWRTFRWDASRRALVGRGDA